MKKRNSKYLWLLIVVLISALATTSVFADTSGSEVDLRLEATNQAQAEQDGVYVIQLKDAPTARYDGGVRQFAGTSASATGTAKFQSQTDAAQAYASYLLTQQEAVQASVEALLGRDLEVPFNYVYAINGFVADLSVEEIALVSRLPEVEQVGFVPNGKLETDRGPAWIGADGVYDGSATAPAPGTMGEGTVVGIIDTGLNLTGHPSFADVGGDGYDHTNPLGAGTYLGWCNPADPNYDASLACNDKVIGAYDFLGSTPNDVDGHGTHVGSTAAGNIVLDSTLVGPTISLTREIGGVAPHANIVMYGVEDDAGGCCNGGALLAAIDQITADASIVDALNYSIGGGDYSPWTADLTPLAFLGAADAGIIVVTSGGNAGPAPQTLGSPGNAPWMLTVGASTHDRKVTNSLTGITSDGASLADIEGVGFTTGFGPAPIVYAGDFAVITDPAQCLEPFPAGTFSGEIVVCDRGSIARTAKGQNVLAGGAGGFVLANVDAQGESISGDGHFLPGLHIGDADGDVLRAFLADPANTNAMATIGGAVYDVNDANGDLMGGFSSRGPQTQGSVIKPDVAAPGVSIWAAFADDGDASNGPDYAFLSGTSMASPHTAGAALLVRDVNPTWTVAEVNSALVSTGTMDVFKEDGTTPADPFDFGGGRIQVDMAATAALVWDETTANFAAADPANGGDPSTLNLASMAQDACIGSCSWTRTVRNASADSTTWDVSVAGLAGYDVTFSPASFTLATDETATIVFTATVNTASDTDYEFGTAMLTPAPAPTRAAAPQHMSMAVKAASGILPDIVRIPSVGTSGTDSIDGLITEAIAALELTESGLVEATLDAQALPLDSNNGSPFDDLTDGVYVTTVTVPADGMRLVAEITESESPDLDLFVGTGTTPNDATLVCTSASGTALEYCNITGDELVAGDYWILVQNWAASSVGAVDAFTLAHAVVTEADAGNMTATGPASVTAGEEFAIDVAWNEAAMETGDRWYGAIALDDAGADRAGDFGVIDVDILVFPPEMLEIDGPAVGFEFGIPSTFAVTDDLQSGLFWTTNGNDSCAGLEADNWVNTSSTVACVSSDFFGTAQYDTSLISNEIDFSPAADCSTVELDFTVNYRDVNNPNPGLDQLDVDVSTDAGATWTTILKLEDDIGGFRVLDSGVDYTLDLAAYLAEASLHVRFRYYNPDNVDAFDWWAQVDDVSLSCVTAPTIDVAPGMLDYVLPVGASETQAMTVTNDGTADLIWTIFEDTTAARNAPTDILYEVPVGGTSGIVSDFFTDSSLGSYAAEEFTLAGFSRIDLMFFPGFNNAGDMPAGTPITWYVFADAAGVPAGAPGSGAELFTHTSTSDGTGVSVANNEITLDLAAAGLDLQLAGGTYWVGVAPSLPGDARWNWYQGEVSDSDAVLYDEGNFGGFDWTTLTGLGVTFGDLALRIEGEQTVASVCDTENTSAYLSLDTAGGTTAPGTSSNVGVTADATTLTAGSTYTSTLCVDSNAADPTSRAQFEIPVTVTVVDAAPAIAMTHTVGTVADACATTTAITVTESTQVYHCLTVTNTGDTPLTTHTISDVVTTRDSMITFNATLAPMATVVITHGFGAADMSFLSVAVTDTTTNTTTFTASGVGGSAQATGATVVTVEEGTAVALQQPVVGNANSQGIIAILTTVLLSVSAIYVLRRKRS